MTQTEMYHIGLALNGILERIMMDFAIMQKGEKMIERLEYYSSGVERGNAVVWVRHPDLDDLVDKVNELIDVINEMEQKRGQDEETL